MNSVCPGFPHCKPRHVSQQTPLFSTTNINSLPSHSQPQNRAQREIELRYRIDDCITQNESSVPTTKINVNFAAGFVEKSCGLRTQKWPSTNLCHVVLLVSLSDIVQDCNISNLWRQEGFFVRRQCDIPVFLQAAGIHCIVCVGTSRFNRP